jgi:hypothetical protein
VREGAIGVATKADGDAAASVKSRQALRRRLWPTEDQHHPARRGCVARGRDDALFSDDALDEILRRCPRRASPAKLVAGFSGKLLAGFSDEARGGILRR